MEWNKTSESGLPKKSKEYLVQKFKGVSDFEMMFFDVKTGVFESNDSSVLGSLNDPYAWVEIYVCD